MANIPHIFLYLFSQNHNISQHMELPDLPIFFHACSHRDQNRGLVFVRCTQVKLCKLNPHNHAPYNYVITCITESSAQSWPFFGFWTVEVNTKRYELKVALHKGMLFWGLCMPIQDGGFPHRVTHLWTSIEYNLFDKISLWWGFQCSLDS